MFILTKIVNKSHPGVGQLGEVGCEVILDSIGGSWKGYPSNEEDTQYDIREQGREPDHLEKNRLYSDATEVE